MFQFGQKSVRQSTILKSRAFFHLRGFFKEMGVAHCCSLAFLITHYTFLESIGVSEEIVASQTAGLGDKGNPQVAKELDKLGNHQ